MENKSLAEGFETYPLPWVIGQNLFFLIYFGIGFAGMIPLRIRGIPAVSLLYAIFLLVMLVFVLRKHLCTNCYYYGKMCSTGWGKLSALLFDKNSGNYTLGLKLATITWGLATLLPILGISAALLINFSVTNLILLFLFLILTPLNFLIHRQSCRKCKMRLICPGSLAKGENLEGN